MGFAVEWYLIINLVDEIECVPPKSFIIAPETPAEEKVKVLELFFKSVMIENLEIDTLDEINCIVAYHLHIFLEP